MDLPAFPLQLLLRREPGWAGLPVVVVAKDEPQGRVLWANEEARRERVLPGQRYAAALSLAQDLRAGVIPEEEIRNGVDEVAARLRRFTPVVDPSGDEPGVFRLDAAGLSHLYPDLRAWAAEMHGDLAGAGLRACVVVGWTEFGAYAVARALAARRVSSGFDPVPSGTSPARETVTPPRSGPVASGFGPTSSGTSPARETVVPPRSGPAPNGSHRGPGEPCGVPPGGGTPAGPHPPTADVHVIVFADEAAERRALRRVPLERLLDRVLDGGADRGGGTSEARDLLAKLGVRTVEDFLALPAVALGERLGGAVRRLHDLASGAARDLLRPAPCDEPVRTSVVLEHPESDGTRLLFIVKRLLDPLLFRTSERRELLAGVELRLRFEQGPSTARRADDNAGARERIGEGSRPGSSGTGVPVPLAAPSPDTRRAPQEGGAPDPAGSDAELTEVVRPAVPTLDALQILDLVRLRLESLQLRSGANEVTLTAQGVAATPAQLALFTEKPRRDLAAADRALARLRAEFGEDAVVCAQLRDGHLPEASFAWERLQHTQLPRVREPSAATVPPAAAAAAAWATHVPAGWLPAPPSSPPSPSPSPPSPQPPRSPRSPLPLPSSAPSSAPSSSSSSPSSASSSSSSPSSASSSASSPSSSASLPPSPASPRSPSSGGAQGAPLVRRIFAQPVPLPPRPRHEPDGWMLRGFEHGNVVRLEGPFVLAGGWWSGEEVRREVHFAETARGRLFWIFYDVRRRRWFLQGEVS